MKIQRLTMIILVIGLAIGTVAVGIIARRPAVTNADVAMQDDQLIFQYDPDNLEPCGAFETMRILQTPEPVTPMPASTVDPAAPTLAPTSTPRPAPTEDRVGFPANYATDFKLLFVFDRYDRKLSRAICGNDIAAEHKEGEPFAYGSVLLMISYSAKLDANGQPVLDEHGHFIREKLVALHVQRKEPGFGEAYGEDRAGEWEFVAFNADGTYQNRPEETNFCAVCHGSEGGESVDHVFRMNLFHDEGAITSPPVGENEISIYLYAFHAPLLDIKAGTTVTWVNNDEASHKVVAAEWDDEGQVITAEEPMFESDVLASVNVEPGATFSFTFDEPGEYLYRCSVHANEVGRILVTE